MKHMLRLSILSLVVFSSCSTAFQAGQTPDDVYYSPGVARPAAEDRLAKEQAAEYEEYTSYLDDRYLRMKVANRYRWSAIDDFGYWYDSRYDFNTFNSYRYSLYNNYGLYGSYGFYNPYAWNSGIGLGYGYGYYPGYGSWGWGSPIYTLVHYATPSFGYTAGSNISAYRNKSYNNSNYGYTDKSGRFVPSGNNSNFSSLMKRVFTPATSTQNASSYDRPVRTYTPTPSTTTPATSSSAGGNSGGYGSTGSSSSSSRPGRGG